MGRHVGLWGLVIGTMREVGLDELNVELRLMKFCMLTLKPIFSHGLDVTDKLRRTSLTVNTGSLVRRSNTPM